MAVEQTFSILKPDVVKKSLTGAINARFEAAGLRLIASKMVRLDRKMAAGFYAEHSSRPFFNEMIDFITSGPVVLQVFQGESAVRRYREIIGATDPAQALAGTIRADYGSSIGENAVHGSDSLTSAQREIAYLFTPGELYSQQDPSP